MWVNYYVKLNEKSGGGVYFSTKKAGKPVK